MQQNWDEAGVSAFEFVRPTFINRRYTLTYKDLLVYLIRKCIFSVAHFRPFDPYAPHDPNNGYPQHFCDLNDDEYGRPYLGPYDQHVDASARNPFPKVPPPDTYTSTSPDRPHKALPEALKNLLDNKKAALYAAGGSVPKNGKKRGDQFMKRQDPPLPACTTLNECSASQGML